MPHAGTDRGAAWGFSRRRHGEEGRAMATWRAITFLVGVVLMALALLLGLVPSPPPRPAWSWLFALGLGLCVAAHGWPEGLR